MEDMIEHLKSNKPKGFTPKPFYSVDGDSLTFYFKDEPTYRERVDDFLTVYLSISSNKLVGCQIKGLPKALELLGDFGLYFIEDKKIRLGMIFMACMAATPDPKSKAFYIELGKVAGETTIPAKELQPILAH